MRFVKDWDGFSAQGKSDARFIADSRVPYLSRRRPAMGDQPGTVATKKPGFLEVRIEQVAVDGFYSVGVIDGEMRVVGSSTARGAFKNRGTFVMDDGLSGVNQIRYYGKGLGQDSTAAYVGDATDFDGRLCAVYDVQTYRTRNGWKFTPFYSFLAVAPFGAGTQLNYVEGEVYGPDGARKFQSSYAYMSLRPDGQHYHAFVRDDGKEQTLGATLFVPNQLAAHAVPVRVSPGNLVMMSAYLRPTYTPTLVDAAACPGLAFSFSTDAGATWSTASATELFHEFFDTVQTLPAPFYASMFNTAVLAAGFACASISARYAVAYVVVPYAPNPGADFVLKAKVKVGLIDTAARTLFGTATLFDGTPAEALAYWSGGCVGVKGGVLLVTRPITTVLADVPNQPAVLKFTPDAVNITDAGTLPQPNYKTGIVTAISPTQIVAPMYEGAHSLYESKDHGATWSKRATLSVDAAAPVLEPDALLLKDFTVLTFLRRDGNPANATPGTPWASDSRVNPPVL